MRSIILRCKIFLSVGSLVLFLGTVVLADLANAQEVKKRELSLEQATELAIANNFDIQLVKYDYLISQEGQDIAESIFDTYINGEVSYSNNQLKATIAQAATKTIDNDYNVGISKKLPSGTTVSVDLDNNRHWTDSPLASSSLSHDSTLGLSVSQDLGKNFFGFSDRGSIQITSLNIENSGYTTQNKIEDSIRSVQKAYWDLVLQREKVKLEEEMVGQAKKLYDLHQEKIKDGLVEAPEAYASEANYKARLNELKFAESQKELKENILRLLLNIEEEDVSLVPTDDLKLPFFSETKKDALKTAFENRRDYKIAKNEIASKDIKLSMKKNNLWPEINLTASFNKNGLGDHFKQSVTNTTAEDNPYLYTGISVKMPIENRGAKAEHKQAELEKAKALLSLKLIERQIAIGVMDQIRDCSVFKQMAVTAQEVAVLQTKKLEEELKRYNTGRSNTDTLIRFQEDVIQARQGMLEAKFNYQAALIDLEKAKGTLLEKYIKEE